MKNFVLKIFIFVLFCVTYSHCAAPQCLDENGNPVDWFVLYKLPRLKKHPDKYIAEGIAYVFITSNTLLEGWKLARHPITNEKSIPGQTLAPLYFSVGNNDVNVSDIFWLFYNDQPPNQPFTRKEGHTKGIVVGNAEGGFWMVHSVPKFPQINVTEYQYPHTGCMYGQSFLCISMSQKNLNEIGRQLMINCANAYNSSFDVHSERVYPDLVKAANKERFDVKMSKEIFSSRNDEKFLSFAKSDKFGKDLYSQWVANVLHADLYVESWLHDDKLPSVCNEPFPVYNVAKVSIKAAACGFLNFKDHSKYAVSNNRSNPWICIGDINRASTQYIRGGGTVCIANEHLWDAYFHIIENIEPCPKCDNRII